MQFTAHAYVARGDAATIPILFDLLKETGIERGADTYARAYPHFGIEEARDLRERASMRAFETRRAFLIAASVITIEAQNALLKTFEEPVAGTIFVLVVPAPQTLLPTLLSRMQPLEVSQNIFSDSPIDIVRFLGADVTQRLEMLRKILEAEDRDVGGAIAFLGGLERALESRLRSADPHGIEGLRAVYRARAYIADKGALMRSLLEQVAFFIPQFSK